METMPVQTFDFSSWEIVGVIATAKVVLSNTKLHIAEMDQHITSVIDKMSKAFERLSDNADVIPVELTLPEQGILRGILKVAIEVLPEPETTDEWKANEGVKSACHKIGGGPVEMDAAKERLAQYIHDPEKAVRDISFPLPRGWRIINPIAWIKYFLRYKLYSTDNLIQKINKK